MPKSKKPKAPALKCLECGNFMAHLADLQPTAILPAVRVYRCHGCDHVLQQER